MKRISGAKLVELAKSYAVKNIPWHHHFLTQKCSLNKSSKFQIILENEKTREIFYSEYDKKPLYLLKRLENLFFDRK